MAKKIPTINANYIRRLQLEDNPEEVIRLIKEFLVETVSIGQTGTERAIASALEDLRSIREGIATNQIHAGDYSKRLVEMINTQINTMDIQQGGRKSQEGIGKRIGSALKSAVSNSLPSPGRFIDAVYNENPLIGYLPKFIKDTVVQTKARSELVNSEIKNAKMERETIEKEYANALLEERELGSTEGESRVNDLYLPILERIDKNLELMMKEWVTLPEDIGEEFDKTLVQLSRDMDKRSEEEMQAAERSRRLELAKQLKPGQSLGFMGAGNQNADVKGGSLMIFGGMKGITGFINKIFVKPLKFIIGGLATLILSPFKSIIKILRVSLVGLTKGAGLLSKALVGFGKISWTGITKGFTMLSRGMGKLSGFFSSGFSRAFTSTMKGLGKIGTGLNSLTKAIKIPGLGKLANLGKLLKGGGASKLFGRANPFIAAAFAVYDLVEGFFKASELTGIPEEDLSFFDRINSGISNFVTKLVGLVNIVTNLFGKGDLVDTDAIYRTVFNLGKSIENFFIDVYNKSIGRLPGFKKKEYAEYMTDPKSTSTPEVKSVPPMGDTEFNVIRKKQRDVLKGSLFDDYDPELVKPSSPKTTIEVSPETTSKIIVKQEEIVRYIERMNEQSKLKAQEAKTNNTIINAPNNNITNIHSSSTNINTSNTDSTFRRTLNR